MDIFFYSDFKIGDTVTISVEDKQIRYRILDINIVEYKGNKFIQKGKKEIVRKEMTPKEIERGNLFSVLFENRSDLILQLDVPSQDRPKFNNKMFIELTRLD